jgi:hypothetical protein
MRYSLRTLLWITFLGPLALTTLCYSAVWVGPIGDFLRPIGGFPPVAMGSIGMVVLFWAIRNSR